MRGRNGFLRVCAILAATTTALLLAGASGAAAPNNDDFSAASVLLPATGSRNGTNVDAGKEAGEPSHAGNAGGASTWYRWVAPATGTATFDTIGSGLDTLLAVYTGPSVDALTLVAQNDDFLGWKWTSRLGFAATVGTTYYIAVDGFDDGTGPAHGTFAVNWDLQPTPAVVQPNDNFASAVQIDGPGGSTSGSSFGATRQAGEPNHAGNVGGRSVWFRWQAPYDGTYTFTTDTSEFNTLLAVYSGIDVGNLVPVAANDDIAWNNLRSSLTFVAQGGTVYSIALDGKKFDYSGAASGIYTLAWSSQSASPYGPANDWFANSQVLYGASGSASGTNAGATEENGEPDHVGNPGGASVWYSWTPTVTANVTVSTAGSSFDTLLGVYTGSTVGALTQIAANDDLGQVKGASEVAFTATAGTTYRIVVDGYKAVTDDVPHTGDVVLAWMQSAANGPANDGFDAATTLTGIGGILNRSTLGATKEAGEPSHAGNPGGASIWYRWRAPGDGQWRFYTQGSAINTLMAVYTGDSVDALTLIGSNDDVSTSNASSSVTIIARNDTTYYIAVDGFRGAAGPAASGDFVFQWELLGPDPALAPNDDFASAWLLPGNQSGSVTASNVQSTKQAGEPNHAANTGGASVWFRWTAPASGYVSWDTPGSSFDTLLGVYTGSDVANLTQVAANDDIQYNHWWPDGRYRESYLGFIALQGQTYYVAVDGRTAPGGSPARGSIFLEWWQNPPSGDTDLLAAGDIHADCSATGDDRTAAIVNSFPDATVAGLGDYADPGSTAAAFADCYGPTWGASKARTRPAIGNHEYDFSPNGAAYFSYFGAKAGAPGKGYYSYEYGGWHVVVLNSMCTEVGGCGPGSAQYQWLQQDLAANVNSCSLAYWHTPRYASSDLKSTNVQPFWDLLYQYGADVILNAHARQYERFAPMTPSGTPDNATGIRQFIVGTGGGDPTPLGAPDLNTELVDGSVFGVLRMTLRTGGYDWQFLPAAGSVFADSGHGTCSGGSAADPQRYPAPAAPTLSATQSSSGQYTVSWKPSSAIPTGASYSLWQKSTNSNTWTQVASGLSALSYKFGAGNARGEGTWVYRVQASGAGKTTDFSPASAQVIVDKTAPLPPLIKPNRLPEYAAGGWWKDTVTVSFLDNGDAVLADGTPGVGVDPASLKAPQTFTDSKTASDQAVDRLGWTSPVASLAVKVDRQFPSLDLKCGDVVQGGTRYATFTAKDDQSGLASPPSGSVLEPSAIKGKNRLTVEARDNVGHVTTKTCEYNVK